jgi:hypothetical protein
VGSVGPGPQVTLPAPLQSAKICACGGRPVTTPHPALACQVIDS